MPSRCTVIAGINDIFTTVIETRGCLQGGVLSFLLNGLLVDGLLRKSSNAGRYTQADDDNVVILAKRDKLDSQIRPMIKFVKAGV